MNCHVSSCTKDPVKILLGTKKKPQGLGSKRRLIEKEEVFVYVPILQTLQALLTNETILAEVNTLMHLEMVIYRWKEAINKQVRKYYRDGSHFRCHSMFGTDSKALQFFFYYDDIEMCNPLGSHTKTHKLGNLKPAHAFVIN